jgi:hypothetical protein
MQRLRRAFVGILLSLVLPVGVSAQDVGSGTFAGVVRDTSGAVLPGVTVEAASPALIEKIRTTVTDGEGRYRIPGLRPGVYTVTFTLPGFRTVRREGIELTTGFIATVNADLSVGEVAETITVSGQAPVVDTKSAGQQQVFSGEVVRELPLGKNSAIYAALLPGATQNALTNTDVGGTKGETENQIGIHGGRPNDGQTFREGNYDGHMFGPFGANALSSINPTTIQEVTVQLTGGLTAEAQTGGIQTNVIVRDGGNRVSGSLVTDFSHRNLQSDNIDDGLRARGVTTAGFLKKNYDVAGGVGGPVSRDKLWLFVDARRWEAFSEYPGIYYNKQKGSLFYTPDLNTPGYSGTYTKSVGARLTWQATTKSKFSFTTHYENTCNCFFQLNLGLVSPEAARSDRYWPYKIAQVNWTHPATNRLLFQAGGLVVGSRFYTDQNVGSTNDISILDRLRNFRYGAPLNMTSTPFLQGNIVGSASYIAGSHAFKAGVLYLRAKRDATAFNNHSVSYTFAGAVPESVTFFAYPNLVRNGLTQTAVYAQDQWTSGDVTLNLGVRFDLFNGYAPATSSPAGEYVPARSFDAVHNVPNWKDVNPRVGVAYNLFGGDRTALKVNIGRFIPYEQLGGLVANNAPANLIVTQATRTWRDANGDFIPQESELGPLSNANFGKVVRTVRYDEELLHGWHVRPYNWQTSASVQHEIASGIGVNIGYFRTWYGNFQITDNMLTTAADYQSFCVTSPGDSRLPNGGGQQICGLVDITPALFGRVDNFVTLSSKYGKQTEAYNGIDLTLNARLAGGGLVAGGLSTARTATDNCEILAKIPEAAPTAAPQQFCKVTPPWAAATQVKLYGAYPLPWDLRVSAVFQNIPGVATTATFVASNALIAPSLGRSLAAGPNGTAAVELIQPNTEFQDGRVSLLGISLTKRFRAGGTRFEPNIDIQNALNANSVTLMNLRYGPAWKNVTGLLPPRMVKFGLRVDF